MFATDRRQADQSGACAAGAAGPKSSVSIRPSYARVGKRTLIKHQRYAQATRSSAQEDYRNHILHANRASILGLPLSE
jgi:hypothetical protein